MSKIKQFSGWLAESLEAVSGVASTWTKPVQAEVAKVVKSGKQNVIQVKSSGKVHHFEIIGVGPFGGKYEINYQKLEKTPSAGLKIYRYVSGGTDPYEVKFSDLATVLPKLAGGQGTTIGGTIGDIKFEKI